jgi:hypothetical protein
MGMAGTDEDDDLDVLDQFDEDDDLDTLDRGDALVEEDAEADPEPEVEVEEEPETEPEPEVEPEAEADVEADPEPEPAPEPEPEAKGHTIPKYRFDEVNERRKAAERRNAELEAQNRANDPANAIDFDFDGKERKYAELVMDGDHDNALALRREIRAAEQAAYRAMAEQQSARTREATKEELQFDTTVQELNTAYPAFDPNTESYDKELVDEALDLHAGFVARGYSAAAALRKAVRYVAAANDMVAAGSAPVEVPSSLDKAPAAKKTNVKAKLDAATRQPPKQQGVGIAKEKKMDLNSMSEEEFDALPEATLRRLRGDV